MPQPSAFDHANLPQSFVSSMIDKSNNITIHPVNILPIQKPILSGNLSKWGTGRMTMFLMTFFYLFGKQLIFNLIFIYGGWLTRQHSWLQLSIFFYSNISMGSLPILNYTACRKPILQRPRTFSHIYLEILWKYHWPLLSHSTYGVLCGAQRWKFQQSRFSSIYARTLFNFFMLISHLSKKPGSWSY